MYTASSTRKCLAPRGSLTTRSSGLSPTYLKRHEWCSAPTMGFSTPVRVKRTRSNLPIGCSSFWRGRPGETPETAVFDVENGNRSRFEGLFRERFGERFYLITVEEAQELEMYGPGRLSPEARRRLGSHVAISKGADALKILYPTPKKDDVKLVSHHSGLTPSEMLVPLVVA